MNQARQERWDRLRRSRWQPPRPHGEAPREAVSAFRDHSAWRDGPGWCQVVGGGLADRGGALFLYRSADLRACEYAGWTSRSPGHRKSRPASPSGPAGTRTADRGEERATRSV
jgi:sucrose-6-phosphate hydrolase SacC (GH32 family)